MMEDTGLARLLQIARRRRAPVALAAGVVAVLGAFWVITRPALHRARAVVRIDDPQPARDYVAPTVKEPAGERLRSRRLGFLARPIVESAARRAGYLKSTRFDERILEDLATRLDARQEGEDTFIITFEDAAPGRAQAFLAALIEAHGRERAREMTERARATAEVFDREVTALRPRVALAEAQVERFRLNHFGALPDQLEANLRLLDELRDSVHSLMASLDAAKDRRRVVLQEALSPLARQEEEVARALSEARARYKPGSREAMSLQAELERVRSERAAMNPGRGRVRAELDAIDRDIARTRGRIDALAAREQELQRRVEAVAENGEALARLTLERDLLRGRLGLLVTKHEEASLATALEEQVAGHTRAITVEPPWVTTAPVGPGKIVLGLLVLAVAMAAGLALGFLLDGADRRVREASDVRRLLGAEVRILGTVPRFQAGRGR